MQMIATRTDTTEIERRALSSMLTREYTRPRYRGKVLPAWFVDSKHRILCGAIEHVVSLTGEQDYAAIAAETHGKWGVPELFALVNQHNGTESPVYHLDRLLKVALSRKLDAVASDSRNNADPVERFAAMEAALRETHTEFLAGVAAVNVHEEFVASINAPTHGIDTGIEIFDSATGGLRPGWVVAIGALTGRGKSAMCCTMARLMAMRGHRVDYISLEMMPVEIHGRMVASMTGIDGMRIMRGVLSDDEKARVIEASKTAFGYPIRILNMAGEGIDSICSHIRSTDAKVVFVDYIGKIDVRGANSTREQMNKVSSRLQQATKAAGCITIEAVQLNRDADKEYDRIPRLYDFKDSGSIEQDADIAMILSIPEFEKADLKTLMTLHVLKFRHGRTGSLQLVFDRPLQRITSAELRFPEPVGRGAQIPESYHERHAQQAEVF